MANKNLKPLHLVCVVDENRPNMKLIKIKKGIATATNGHMIVKVDLIKTSALEPHQIDLLDGKHIHMMVWQAIMDAEHVEIKESEIVIYKGGVKIAYEYTNPQGEFFNTDSILISAKEEGEQKQRLVGYSAKNIKILAQVFESQEMYFSFGNNGKSIVFPSEDSGMYALLMGLDTDGTNRYMFI